MLTGPKAWAAEFIGTFVFVSVGASAAMNAGASGFGLFGVAAAHGLAIAAMIAVFGKISGGHFNPAVTLSVLLGRRMRRVDALGYIGAQIIGGLAAAGALAVVLGSADLELGAPKLRGVSIEQAFLLEALLTFVLVMVIWGTGIDDRGTNLAPFAIGGTVFAAILSIGVLTGAALNPARYFGPAAVAGDLSQWWLYFSGPIAGALLAGVIYTNLFMGNAPTRR